MVSCCCCCDTYELVAVQDKLSRRLHATVNSVKAEQREAEAVLAFNAAQ